MSDDCGCCATPPSDGAIENRPGLTAIAYRPGTFATFKQGIIEELARAGALKDLTARSSDDYTIAAVELWAAVADVLAFYQERTANESFLRTALLRDSMLRLVRLIGYELAPGVAAQTWLAFTVERGATAMVPARTRVKSAPVTTELPVTFETMEPLDADATWNALEPFRLRRHVLQPGDEAADFAGVATGLLPGDLLVFTGKKKRHNPKSTHWDVARVRSVTLDPARRRTRVTWGPPLGSHAGRRFPKRAHVYVLRQRGAVFGHNASDWHVISDAGKQQLLGLPAPGDVTNADRREWPQFEIYAPLDPNKPRTLVPNGVLTIPPTAESVAAAAIAAAKASKEAVLADVFAAVSKAAASLQDVIAKANQVSAKLTTLGITAAATQANAAAARFANVQNAVAQLQADLNGLPGTIGGFIPLFAAESANPFVGPVAATANLFARVAGATGVIQARAVNLVSDTFVSAVRALTDVLGTFKKISDDGGFSGTGTNTLKKALDDAVAAALAAFGDVEKAGQKIFEPLGAIATEKAVEAAVRWTIDNHDVLDDLIPPQITDAQRVGIAAMVAAKFTEIALSPADAALPVFVSFTSVPTNGEIATVLQRAGVLVGAAVAGSTAASAIAVAAIFAAPFTIVSLIPGVIAAAALWPLIFAGVAVGVVIGDAARPGATRVANDVIKAVIAALEVAHPAAPWRYLPRILTKNRIDLDMVYPRIVGGSWVLLSSPLRDELYRVAEVEQTSRTDYGLTGAVTRLKLKGNGLAPQNGHNPYFHIRETAVFGASEELKLALDTAVEPFSGTTIDVTGAPAEVAAGRTLVIAGVDAATGEPASNVVTLVDQTSAHPAGTGTAHTILRFAPAVTRPYALDGLVVHGNVAYATNGETVRNEIVGDGDASQGFQKFPLRKKPVSYAPDRKTGVVTSSLTLLVNGTKWDEVPTLYGTSPGDRVYTSRIADDTTLTVTFGDGVTGSRLTTGRQNVVAQYRQGIGAGGNIVAGRIKTLLDRPAALRAAMNPAAAEGGVDPESLANARVAAPGSVRTFGRAVSLRDFEDSTLFNGIVAKASATWVWTGERRAIHLTVAAAGGGILSDDAKDRLRIKLDGQRDINHRLLIDNYVRVPILIDAALTVDERHVAADVQAAARAALLATLAFEARGFGQPVYVSDIFSILQQIPGVLFVDVNKLDLKNGDSAFRARHGVDDTIGQPQPRLMMLPARPDAATGTVRPAELAVVEADGDVTLSVTGGISL